MGKPVIASNVGGIPELVEHNKTGYLVEIGNVEQIKNAVIKLYENPELTQEMGKNARKKAETQYNRDVFYKSIIEIYEKTLADR